MAGHSSRGYADKINNLRHQKDEAFKYESWSPIAADARVEFVALAYFAPDERWRAKAQLHRLEHGGVFEMGTSTGEARPQLRFVRLDFATPHGKASLVAYKDASHAHEHGHHEDRTLFLPFRDKTSGASTYGAGRYLDLREPTGDELVVDFNLAYNPYCAYSESYSCPLPPPENWLEIPVEAGEKSYAHHPE